MQFSRSSVAVRIVAVTLAFALGVPVAPAFALLEDEAKYESSTNPGVGPDVTWRWDWGNTFDINLVVTTVPGDGAEGELTQTDGFIYEFHQIDPSGNGTVTPEWGISSLSPKPEGPFMGGTFDVAGVVAREGWTAYEGSHVAGEGMYGLTIRYYNQFRTEEETATDSLYFGVDLTPPRPVDDLTSTASAVGGNPWSEARWRELRWTPKAYDDLSGVGGFKIKINGTQGPFAKNIAPDLVLEPYGALWWPVVPRAQLSNVTVEDLPAGESTIEVITVDRATNESTPRTVKAYVDPDSPTLSISSPSSNGLVSAKPKLSVVASDAAGISKVRYYVDDQWVGTSATKPFSLSPDLSSFTSGTHTLKVIAYDMIGDTAGTWRVPHTATASRIFRIDKTKPTLSSVTGGPTPFYPRKRDGYRDNFVVKFKSSETATAKLVIKDSAGKTWRTLTKSVKPGSSSLTWNGKSASGSMKQGTFKWYLTLTDTAGNVSVTKSGKTSVKYYILVRVSGNKVKVIEH